MKYNIAVIKGDGIGPEIVTEAMKALDAVGKKYGHEFVYTESLAGGCAIDAEGIPLPQETIDICKASDSVLLGAVGGPKWDNQPGHLRAEKAIRVTDTFSIPVFGEVAANPRSQKAYLVFGVTLKY